MNSMLALVQSEGRVLDSGAAGLACTLRGPPARNYNHTPLPCQPAGAAASRTQRGYLDVAGDNVRCGVGLEAALGTHQRLALPHVLEILRIGALELHALELLRHIIQSR